MGESFYEKKMDWPSMIEGLYLEMKQLLSQEEMEKLVDDLTAIVYAKGKRTDEDRI